MRRRNNLTQAEYEGRRCEFAARGQDITIAKLLDIHIVDIRSAHRQRLKLLQYIRDNLSNAALAKRHGIAVSNVEKIVTYKAWSHIA